MPCVPFPQDSHLARGSAPEEEAISRRWATWATPTSRTVIFVSEKFSHKVRWIADPPATRHALLSVCPLQLHILCSLCAFVMLERLSAARVESKVDGLYVFSLLNGALEPYVEATAIGAAHAGRSGPQGFAIEEAHEKPMREQRAVIRSFRVSDRVCG